MVDFLKNGTRIVVKLKVFFQMVICYFYKPFFLPEIVPLFYTFVFRLFFCFVKRFYTISLALKQRCTVLYWETHYPSRRTIRLQLVDM